MGWWDLAGMSFEVLSIKLDGWDMLPAWSFWSKGDWGGETRGTVDAVLFGVVGEFSVVSLDELWESFTHCVEVAAPATAVAHANDDKLDVVGPSNNDISGCLVKERKQFTFITKSLYSAHKDWIN